MKRYAAIIVIEVLVVVAALGMVIKTAVSGNNSRKEKIEADVPTVLSGAEELLENEDSSSDIDDKNGNTPSGDDISDQNDFPEGEEGSNGSGGHSYSGGSSYNGSGYNQWSAAPAVELPVELPTISFPYTVSDTGIVIQQVGSYDGYFIEDGSDREVTGITAIVITNNGGDLDFVGIGIAQGKRNLAFSGSQIPAGATVIIQEQSGAAFSTDPFYSATATITPATFEQSDDLVKIEDNKDGSFSVINISDQTLSEVQIYFKNYLPEEAVYVGGITYSLTLEDIDPGMAMDVMAGHYDANYTVFVDIHVEQKTTGD